MANHKWRKEEETEWGTKPHSCTNCGVTKRWHGGDYQCWEYTWFTSHPAHGGGTYTSTHDSWTRPDCEKKSPAPTPSQ